MTQEKKQNNQRNLTEKGYQKLSRENKIAVLMLMKNRAKLRTVLAVYMTKVPFEQFSNNQEDLLKLGEKLFKVNPQETLIKED